MSDEKRFSELLALLLGRLGPSMDFPVAARELGFPTPRAAYLARRRGKFPVRVVDIGGRLAVLTADLADFLATGRPQTDEPSAPPRKKPGRPTNAERAARARQQEGGV